MLGFVGLKMVAEYWIVHEEGGHLVSPALSLAVIVSLLGASIVASLIAKRLPTQPVVREDIVA